VRGAGEAGYSVAGETACGAGSTGGGVIGLSMGSIGLANGVSKGRCSTTGDVVDIAGAAGGLVGGAAGVARCSPFRATAG